jgi:hypothetical protein
MFMKDKHMTNDKVAEELAKLIWANDQVEICDASLTAIEQALIAAEQRGRGGWLTERMESNRRDIASWKPWQKASVGLPTDTPATAPRTYEDGLRYAVAWHNNKFTHYSKMNQHTYAEWHLKCAKAIEAEIGGVG